jgi:hypothetical protein
MLGSLRRHLKSDHLLQMLRLSLFERMHLPLLRFSFHLLQVVFMQHHAKAAIFDRLSHNYIFVVDFQAV